MSDVTAILERMQAGDDNAVEELLPVVYQEMHRIAVARMSYERPGHTLQPTALIHEAWLKLFTGRNERAEWKSRQGFYRAVAEAMRRILVDAARKRTADKRGGMLTRQELSTNCVVQRETEILEVSEALDSLELADALAAELVKLRYFAGLTMDHAAEVLGVSRGTAYQIWTFARAFLKAAIDDQRR
jgi:RNA polymerase sigma factor (TIGR02999 family)